MKLIVLMPNVSACEVHECAYNTAARCHARAITVGDGRHAACDTFFPSRILTTSRSRKAGVGACKVTSCRFNEDLECQASAIRVGHHDKHADCLTFEPK